MLDELAVTLTDWVLAIAGSAFAIRALQRPNGWSWAVGFAGLALGSLCGGIWHGFHDLASSLRAALWTGTLAFLGLGIAGFAVAVARSFLASRARRVVELLAALELAVWMIWIQTHDAFVWLTLASAPVLALMLVLSLRGLGRGIPGAGWIALGGCASIVAGGVQALGPDPAAAFDRNALYHVILLVALLLLDRGVQALPADRASR